MVLSARLVALAALGALLAAWSAVAVLAYAAGLAIVTAADLELAGRIAALRLGREPTAPVRLRERAETVLIVANAGRRAVRATVRDAWVPSAGATPRSRRVIVPSGERRRIVTALVPTRRGERRTGQVTIRSSGPLGLAARQRQLDVPGTLQVLPAFGSRRFLPGPG